VAAVLTTNDIKDNEVFEDLLEQVQEPINQVSADGAYDTFECYEQILEREAEPVIPPRINAVQHPELDANPCGAARNQVIKEIEEKGSKIWKQNSRQMFLEKTFASNSDYHRRSLADTKSAQLNCYV
jgi:hypothetical protein